ncbi:ATP-dependent zinc metalloprotease YME1L1 [Podospora australis]|uniref:ATP-dependent zinc metalloprotease YME1L1 n=1 Tax=Podospora australis TaxID=1536484 RepID=A0AAN6WJ50_9PEZI|nr:ATP-dependent zinc metalloprotease YME1L1 [Podospora australis]
MGRSRSGVSETMHKWRYKVSHIGQSGDKTLSDFPSEDKSASDGKSNPKGTTAASGKAKKSELGGTPAIKTLYEGPSGMREGGGCDWVDYPPRQLSKSAAKAHSQVAIRVYKIKDPSKPVISGKFDIKYHAIEIQNPLLVAALAPILKQQSVHLDTNEPANFQSPFCELFFSYQDLAAKHESLAKDNSDESKKLRPYLELLLKLPDEVFSETRAKLKNLEANKLVSFVMAWTLFPSNRTVINWENDCAGALLAKVKSAEYKKRSSGEYLELGCMVYIFNGATFVSDVLKMRIPSFNGNKPVTDLAVYPVDFFGKKDKVMQRLTERGRRVLDMQGLTYANYSGVAFYMENNMSVRHNVEGRILVDVFGYAKYHLKKGSREGTDLQSTKNRLVDERNKENVEKKVWFLRLEKKEPTLMFIQPWIEGYALGSKLWLNFFVDDIKPIKWNDQAYDHLVYDEQQKDLVLSFVESHQGSDSSDQVSGPGQAKTNAMVFEMATDWYANLSYCSIAIGNFANEISGRDAVILLDEADVFMAERAPHDIIRNELVSIFLRELEYFKGILFLTTNLYSTIDSAFRSRVSLHLLFKPLTLDARMAIWRKFLGRAAGEGKAKAMDYDDIKDLAAWTLNGRDIKTAVKMATIWCAHKGYELSMARLENGIRVTSPHVSKMDHGDTSSYD